jgi:hypothetical protein
MAIHRIRRIPDELPHARLYLDDIEEISKILLESHAAAEIGKKAKIVYSVGDVQMDSIDDLQTYGGSVANFEIKLILGTARATSIKLRSRFVKPRVELYYLDEEKRWAPYGEIKSIFDRRQLRAKNAIETLPAWLKWLLYALVFVAFPQVIFRLKPGDRLVERLILISSLGISALYAFVVLQPSRAFFVRSHERSRMSSEATKANLRAIAFLVLGAVIGGAISQLISRLFHK